MVDHGRGSAPHPADVAYSCPTEESVEKELLSSGNLFLQF